MVDASFPNIPGYEVLAKIGQGAMGTVYRAKYGTSGKECALKVLAPGLLDQPKLVERFEREIAALRKLKHPNIAAAVGYGASEDMVFLAMEFINGPDLGSLLKANGPMTEIDVLRIVLQVARALKFAHDSAGLIHRDIKPSNLLVTANDKGEPQVKIIDFGLARTTSGINERLTIQGAVLGTPYYMSPEQITGAENLDIRTDIYALGATAYHLLTGSYPYNGNAPVEILTGHLTAPVPDARALRKDLDADTGRLIVTAMQKDPQMRFLDYNGMIVAVEKVLKRLMLAAPSAESNPSSALRQAVTAKITKIQTRRITRKPDPQ